MSDDKKPKIAVTHRMSPELLARLDKAVNKVEGGGRTRSSLIEYLVLSALDATGKSPKPNLVQLTPEVIQELTDLGKEDDRTPDNMALHLLKKAIPKFKENSL